jgi:diamine N-acetyltransferase
MLLSSARAPCLHGRLSSNVMRHSHRIRSGRTEDANRLAVLAAQVWLHTYAIDGINEVAAQYILSEVTPEKYSQSLNEPSTHFLVAERDENLIGFARVKFGVQCPTGASSAAELQTLYVQEHYVGHGVGKSLLQAAEAKASEQSESALWLTVNAKNHRAISFYAHLGYSKVGTAYFVLGEGRHENHVLIGRDA